MAILHEEVSNGSCYQVRSAGKTRRLYTDGVFHTQYHPEYLFTNAVWDVLSLPALYAQHPPTKILMLGVGGGAAIHQLQQILSPDQITGIDINPIHLRLARRFFNLKYPNLKLITGDAIRHIRTRRRRYDLIVDDVFVEAFNPVRPIQMDENWIQKLSERLTANGLLIQNHISTRSLNNWLQHNDSFLRQTFSSLLVFRSDTCTNAVMAAFKEPASSRNRQQAHQQLTDQFGRGVLRRLNYRVETRF